MSTPLQYYDLYIFYHLTVFLFLVINVYLILYIYTQTHISCVFFISASAIDKIFLRRNQPITQRSRLLSSMNITNGCIFENAVAPLFQC